MEENNTGFTPIEKSETERAEIRERYNKTYFPRPVKEPVWFGRNLKTRIPGKYAIIDQNIKQTEAGTPYNEVFGICTDAYRIIRHEDVVGMVEDVVAQITEFGKIQICPRSIQGGAKFVVGIKFPECKTEIRKLDAIFPKIDVMSSYDLGWKLSGKFGAWQLKCTNGMGVWKSFEKFSKRHLVSLDPSKLRDTIAGGLQQFGVQIDQWKKWDKILIPNKETYDRIWEMLPFSVAEKEKIEVLPEIGSGLLLGEAVKRNEASLWTLNSLATQYATHVVKSDMRRFALETDIARGMEKAFEFTQAA